MGSEEQGAGDTAEASKALCPACRCAGLFADDVKRDAATFTRENARELLAMIFCLGMAEALQALIAAGGIMLCVEHGKDVAEVLRRMGVACESVRVGVGVRIPPGTGAPS